VERYGSSPGAPSGPTERFSFQGSGGDRLDARLELPAGPPAAFALFAHCFTCSKDSAAAARISRALAGRGIGVLRFDFTGLGSSAGDFANTTFTSNVDDLVRAAAAMRASGRPPRILLGHSLGGAAVLAAAGSVPEAVAVVTVNAPFDPGHVVSQLAGSAGPVPGSQEHEEEHEGDPVTVEIAGRSFRVSRRFLAGTGARAQEESIGGLRKALLVLHAPTDTVVGIDHARRIFDAARHPKSFVSLDSADHLLTTAADSDYVAGVVAAWASRYLDAPAERDGEVAAAAGRREGVVDVTEVRPDGLAQDIRAGRHVLRADEPEGVGDDTGPTPYDLLLAALGACTSMTVRMYARRKGWPLERVSVHVTHDRAHATDCEGGEAGAGAVERIERVLDVEGPLSQEQRQRLLEMAGRCPVHRTLAGNPRIATRLAGTSGDDPAGCAEGAQATDTARTESAGDAGGAGTVG
jgi:putative redox protein